MLSSAYFSSHPTTTTTAAPPPAIVVHATECDVGEEFGEEIGVEGGGGHYYHGTDADAWRAIESISNVVEMQHKMIELSFNINKAMELVNKGTSKFASMASGLADTKGLLSNKKKNADEVLLQDAVVLAGKPTLRDADTAQKGAKKELDDLKGKLNTLEKEYSSVGADYLKDPLDALNVKLKSMFVARQGLNQQITTAGEALKAAMAEVTTIVAEVERLAKAIK
jgi:hypothetical protein